MQQLGNNVPCAPDTAVVPSPGTLIATPAACLAVVEVYQSWCGPCKAVQSTFKRLYFEFTDRPLKFYSVSHAGGWSSPSDCRHLPPAPVGALKHLRLCLVAGLMCSWAGGCGVAGRASNGCQVPGKPRPTGARGLPVKREETARGLYPFIRSFPAWFHAWAASPPHGSLVLHTTAFAAVALRLAPRAACGGAVTHPEGLRGKEHTGFPVFQGEADATCNKCARHGVHPLWDGKSHVLCSALASATGLMSPCLCHLVGSMLCFAAGKLLHTRFTCTPGSLHAALVITSGVEKRCHDMCACLAAAGRAGGGEGCGGAGAHPHALDHGPVVDKGASGEASARGRSGMMKTRG